MGVTTFFIDEKIDTGAVILQKEIPIEADENAGALHDKLMNLGADLVTETLKNIAESTVTTKLQLQTTDLKTAYKLNKDNTKIDWNLDTETIYNLIRGLSPYPTAWSFLKNREENPINVKFYDVEKEIKLHNEDPGAILADKKEVKVATKDGFINLKEIQLPGKRKMNIKDILNGYEFDKKAKML